MPELSCKAGVQLVAAFSAAALVYICLAVLALAVPMHLNRFCHLVAVWTEHVFEVV
jgi:hypothetical protein